MFGLKLRSKILIIIAVAVVVSTGVSYYISRSALMNSLVSLEEVYAHDHVLRVGNAFQGKVDYLAMITADWGSWNDTYGFILDVNEDYIRTNLVDSTFRELQLNFIIFVDLNGRVAYAGCFDFHSDEGEICPADFAGAVAGYWTEILGEDFDKDKSGVIALPWGNFIAACHPILRSDDTGPARGRLIMGRAVNRPLVEEIEEAVNLSISMRPLDSPGLVSALPVDEPSSYIVNQIDGETIAGYYTFSDMKGNPVAVLETLLPRQLYARGKKTLFQYAFWFLGAGVMVVLLLYFLLDRFVVARLARVNEAVKKVKDAEDMAGLIEIKGSDEVAELAREINAMGLRLRIAHATVRAQEKRLQKISFKLLNAQEMERKRLARELHDEFGQTLGLLKIRLKSLGKSMQQITETQRRELHDEILFAIDTLINDVRRLTKDLSPAALEDLGLWASLEWLARRFEPCFEVSIDIAPSAREVVFPSDKGIAVFRIVQEALSNAAKHSGAGRVEIQAFTSSGWLIVRIEDDGAGFDVLNYQAASSFDKGMGLSIMDQRAEMLGGKLAVRSEPQGGTGLTLSIPLTVEEATIDE